MVFFFPPVAGTRAALGGRTSALSSGPTVCEAFCRLPQTKSGAFLGAQRAPFVFLRSLFCLGSGLRTCVFWPDVVVLSFCCTAFCASFVRH